MPDSFRSELSSSAHEEEEEEDDDDDDDKVVEQNLRNHNQTKNQRFDIEVGRATENIREFEKSEKVNRLAITTINFLSLMTDSTSNEGFRNHS